jgi:hypothetical protein
MSSSRLAVFVLTMSGVVTACGSSADPSNSQQQPASNKCANETRAEPFSAGVTFEGTHGVSVSLVDSNPAPPAEGDNTWTLEVKESGTDVADATITAEQKMVDHGHPGAKRINITSQGGGSYEAAPVNFNMPGYWTTTFHVKTATVEDDVVVKLCIP